MIIAHMDKVVELTITIVLTAVSLLTNYAIKLIVLSIGANF